MLYCQAIDVFTGNCVMLIFLGFVASVVTFSSEPEQEEDLVMRNFKKAPRRGKWLLAAR